MKQTSKTQAKLPPQKPLRAAQKVQVARQIALQLPAIALLARLKVLLLLQLLATLHRLNPVAIHNREPLLKPGVIVT